MRIMDRLFRRHLRAYELRELPRGARARLTEVSLELALEEKRVQELLKLPIQPCLSLIDEETGTLVTGAERAELLAQAEKSPSELLQERRQRKGR